MKSAPKEIVSDQRIAETRHVVSEVEFVPEGFGKAVKVRVYRYSGAGEMPYFFDTSHYPHTPIQAAPYIADPWENSAGAAAKRAVEGILAHIEEAKNKGFFAHDGWLVENALWT